MAGWRVPYAILTPIGTDVREYTLFSSMPILVQMHKRETCLAVCSESSLLSNPATEQRLNRVLSFLRIRVLHVFAKLRGRDKVAHGRPTYRSPLLSCTHTMPVPSMAS